MGLFMRLITSPVPVSIIRQRVMGLGSYWTFVVIGLSGVMADNTLKFSQKFLNIIGRDLGGPYPGSHLQLLSGGLNGPR